MKRFFLVVDGLACAVSVSTYGKAMRETPRPESFTIHCEGDLPWAEWLSSEQEADEACRMAEMYGWEDMSEFDPDYDEPAEVRCVSAMLDRQIEAARTVARKTVYV